MKWDRGFKRITLVLSIVGAVAGAVLFLYDSARVLKHNKSILEGRRGSEFTEMAGQVLIVLWKQAETFADQNTQWITWTGESLPTEPWWQNESLLEPDDPNGPKWMRESIRLTPTAEELVRLKEQGWETAEGEPLPYTPMGVWYIKRDRVIKDFEETVRTDQIHLAIAVPFGAGLGFGAVWGFYAVTRRGAWPLLIWIRRGFGEDKQKDGQETNESGTASDC